jgi:thymidylate synthase (FAD)
MKIIKQSWEFLNSGSVIDALHLIEAAGRTCYKSEDKMTEESAPNFVRRIIKSGHHSVLEHFNISIRIITDRGVTHEIVRHRLASYSQESTRYCNYSQEKFGKEITVILPVWFGDDDLDKLATEPDLTVTKQDPFDLWYMACRNAEIFYFALLSNGQSPQQARSVLPNSLKTEIVMTCNIREWRHFFTLRTSAAAHPQMRELATSMLRGFKETFPVFFEDLQRGEE